MTTIQSISLTREQIQQMIHPTSDWMRLTPEQEEFIRATGTGEQCTFYGDEILRLSNRQLEAIYEVAFKQAAAAALKELGRNLEEDIEVSIDSPEPGQLFVRVTVSDRTGKSASAIGMLPDPRTH